METTSAFTVPEQLHVERLVNENEQITIYATTTAPCAHCPVCQQYSRRVHGCYERTLADLPWCGVPVKLRLRVRKFFCDESACERRIFAERLPELARPFSRSTDRQRDALEWIAFALGGEAGARLAHELGLLVSPDTLLNRIRSAFREAGDAREPVRVLGVDDFAFRKGNAYGTILVDLERHKVVDLLPERSQQSLVAWLGEHPEVEVATRDRSNVYREGLNAGAPDALQVTDRWHLLHGLKLALDNFLLQKRKLLREAATPEATTRAADAQSQTYIDPTTPGPTTPNRPRRWQARQEEAARKRHERLVEQWKEIRRLYLAGADVRHIAHWLGISPRTVYYYKDLEEPPPRRPYKRKASVLDPYVPYLVGRWKEGVRNGKKLLQEIRERGYTNSEKICATFIAELRRAEAAGKPPSSVPRAQKGAVAGTNPSAKNVASLFMRREKLLSEEQKKYLDRLCSSDAALADARQLTQELAEMVRELEGQKLDEWLQRAESSEAAVMRRYAAGLKKDIDAVRAGLTQRWSNGPVEGFVHKLKLLKRQGYGRANFDLLRTRTLAA